jgi:hypothetical protein
MILIYEHNFDYMPVYDDLQIKENYGYILCDQDMKVFEISNAIRNITGIGYDDLKSIEESLGKLPDLEDIFEIHNNHDFTKAIADGETEFQVSIR